MRSHPDRTLVAMRFAVFALACVGLLWLASLLVTTGDYQVHGGVSGDNAGPAINALVHGRLITMVRLQPLMGLVSLVWRAPFTALGGSPNGYRFGCFACFLPVVGLVGWMACRASSARELRLVLYAAAAIVLGPATVQAATVGHPEEVLATVLATAAVLSATTGRRGWAAVLLGLAIGTKQWAILATPCVLLAVPDGRTRMAALAAAVALPAIALLPLADPSAFSRAEASVGGFRFVEPFSLWWIAGGALAHTPDHLLPGAITRAQAAGGALVFSMVALWAYGRHLGARRNGPVDGLALLALVGLLRCVTDPDPLTYNFVAVVIPLAVWEATVLRRLPVLTASCSVVLWLLPTYITVNVLDSRLWPGAGGLWVISVLCTLALGFALVRRLVAPALNRPPVRGRGSLRPANLLRRTAGP